VKAPAGTARTMPPRSVEGKCDLARRPAAAGAAAGGGGPPGATGFGRVSSGLGCPPECLDLAAFGPHSAALMSAEPDPTKTDKQAARDARLAAALRENLRRRKRQARARAGGTASETEDETASETAGKTGGARGPAPAGSRAPKSGASKSVAPKS
jgi:hypothetical protein